MPERQTHLTPFKSPSLSRQDVFADRGIQQISSRASAFQNRKEETIAFQPLAFACEKASLSFTQSEEATVRNGKWSKSLTHRIPNTIQYFHKNSQQFRYWIVLQQRCSNCEQQTNLEHFITTVGLYQLNNWMRLNTSTNSKPMQPVGKMPRRVADPSAGILTHEL